MISEQVDTVHINTHFLSERDKRSEQFLDQIVKPEYLLVWIPH